MFEKCQTCLYGDTCNQEDECSHYAPLNNDTLEEENIRYYIKDLDSRHTEYIALMTEQKS